MAQSMDVDISDILADISRPSQNSYTDTGSTYGSPYTYDPSTAATDHILLTRAWTSERGTPSLLPYPSSLITRVMDRVRQQITKIEDMTSGIYESQSAQPAQNLNLVLSILQTDLSRTQFLVRSYLRCRLQKVTKFSTYYFKHHVESSDSAEQQDTKSPLLSAEETKFLQHHNTLLTNLYNQSFLLSLPPSLRRLDDSTGGSARMDEGPDTATGVMVRCLAKEWSNEREVFDADAGPASTQREEEKPTVELRCERGGILVARWRDVRSGVLKGDLEVL